MAQLISGLPPSECGDFEAKVIVGDTGTLDHTVFQGWGMRKGKLYLLKQLTIKEGVKNGETNSRNT